VNPRAARWIAALLTLAGSPAAATDLQARIDATPPGGTLRLAPGTYTAPVVLRQPIHLEGAGQATLDAGGKGSVVRLLTDGAELRGLRLLNSGHNHDQLDAGVQVRGSGNVVADNVIEDCLFGIDLQESNRNRIEGNQIRSKSLDLGVRGDGIRLWYSRENQILENELEDVRDVVVWYSGDNVIARNRVSGSRYALHFMYSEKNLVLGNRYLDNLVGIFLMYSDSVEVRGNWIRGARGATGVGIGFKESSDVLLEDNTILYSAKGIYLDISPYQPDMLNRFFGNTLAYNGVGVMFHSEWHGNVFRRNHFEQNFTQVAVRGRGGATNHVWEANYWDDYRGFDRDRDGVGDTPHSIFAYADQIWMDVPSASFFRGSLVFEALDFLDRLAPFTEPTQILEDSTPRFSRPPAGDARLREGPEPRPG
jgi:nitrous oxidase accessory protein